MLITMSTYWAVDVVQLAELPTTEVRNLNPDVSKFLKRTFIQCWDGRHSSLYPTLPTILRTRSRIPCTTSTLCFFNLNCNVTRRAKINKRGQDWHIFKKTFIHCQRLAQWPKVQKHNAYFFDKYRGRFPFEQRPQY